MFAVELTQVSADFGNNFCIKSLFIDLFEGRADGNRAIIVKKLNLPFIHLEDIEQIKSFLSDDIIAMLDNYIKRKEYKDGDEKFYRYFLYKKNKTATPINIIKREYKNNLCELLTGVEEAVDKKIINNKELFIDISALKSYLNDLRDKIAPQQSIPSDVYQLYYENEAYHKILARVFLSLLFLMQTQGKRNYPLKKGKENEESTLTGEQKKLLTEIWLIDKATDEGLIKYRIKNFYNNQKYADAYRLLSELKENNSPMLFDDNELQYYFAKIVLKGKNSEKGDISYSIAFDFINKNPGNPDLQYLLYELYTGKYNSNQKDYTDSQKAKEHFKKALEMGSKYAVIQECMQLQNNPLPEYSKIATLLNKADYTKLEESFKGKYHYLKGIICINEGRLNEADEEFDKAIRFGYTQARSKKQKHYRQTNEITKNFAKNSDNIIIINSNNQITATFLRDVPETYSLYTIRHLTVDKTLHYLHKCDCVGACIKDLGIPSQILNKKLIFAFLGDDNQENLNDCLELLDILYNYALDIMSPGLRAYFIQAIEIYVKSDYSNSSLFLDASLSDMDDIFFKVHLIDYNRAAAHYLIWNCPLYKVFLANNNETSSNNNIVIFGSGELSTQLHREMLAATYIGEDYAFNIYNYCEPAEMTRIEQQHQLDMPGFYSQNSKINGCQKPQIKSVELKNNAVFQSIQNANDPVLATTKYYVVDVGSDMENIEFAVNLRRTLAKQNLLHKQKDNYLPLIAVYCKDPKTAYLAQRMTISNSKQTDVWYNNYNLYFFGMVDTIFSFDALMKNELEMLAEQINIQYAGGNNSLQTQNGYYSFRYNQDSSLLAAIAIRYRLFLLGCYENKNVNSNFSVKEDQQLLQKRQVFLEVELEKYGKIEQIRWCNYMITRGWDCPTEVQLDTYFSCPETENHKLLLPLLHPYLSAWENLDDGELFRKVETFYKEKEKTPTPPTVITKNGVITALKSLEAVVVKETYVPKKEKNEREKK